MSMLFVAPISLNSVPNSIQIDWRLCETIGAAIFAFSNSGPVTLNQRQSKLD